MAVASPGGREIGRVSVRVVPNTSKFATDTEKYLKRVEKTLKVAIPTTLDTTGVKRDLAKLKTELAAFGRKNKLTLTASVETRAIEGAVKTATKKAITSSKANPIKVPVKANQDDFNTSMKALGKKIAKQAAFKLQITPEDELTRQKLKKLVKSLEKSTKVKVSVEPEEAVAQRQRVAKIVKRIEAIAKTLPEPDVPIELRVKADLDDFNASMKAMGQKLAKDAAFKLGLEPEDEKTRRKLKKLVAALAKETSVPVPLEPEAAVNQRAKVAALVRSIGDIAARFNPPTVPVELRADRDPLIAQLKRDAKRIAQQVAIQLPVEAEADAHQLNSLVDELERQTSIKLPVDLDERTNLRLKVQGLVRGIQQMLDDNTAPPPVIRPKLDFLDKAFNVARFKAFASQLSLITARFLAYVALLGPGLLLAAAGVQAMVSTLAVGLPLVAALAAGVGALALGFDALFGPKVDGERLGGVFRPIREAVGNLRVEVGALITQGMDPLVDRLLTTAFPVFAAGMKRVAVATRGAIQEMLAFATSAKFLDSSQTLFAGSATAITTLGRSFAFFTSGLLTLAVAAIPAMQQVSEGLLGLAARFSGFLERAAESGALQETINTAVQDTFAFVGGVARIAGELIGLLHSLEPVAERVFAALGEGLSAIVTGLDSVLKNFALGGPALLVPLQVAFEAILQALGSVNRALFEALSLMSGNETFQQFFLALVEAVGALADAAAQVVRVTLGTVAALSSLIGVPILMWLTQLLDGLAQLAQAASDNVFVVGLLATALTVYLARGLRVLVEARLLAVLSPLITAMSALSTAAFAAGVSLQTMGFRAAIGSVMTSLSTGVRTLTASIAGLAAAAGTAALYLAVLAAPFAIIAARQNNLSKETAKANEEFNTLVDGINGLDVGHASEVLADLTEHIRAYGELDKRYANNFARGWDLVTNGPLSQAEARAKAAGDAIDRANDKIKNSHENLRALATQTGISYDFLEKLSLEKNIDLTKPLNDADTQRAFKELLSDLDEAAAKTRLTSDQVIAAVGLSREAWQQYGEEVKKATEATKQAFEAQTNLVQNIDVEKQKTAAEALTKAQEKQTDAERERRELKERLAASVVRTGRQEVTAAQQLEEADRKVAEAAKAVADAQKEVDASSIAAQVKDLFKTVQAFNSNIDTLVKRGLDPKIIQDLLLAGPKQAGPLAQALVSDHSGRLIKMFNDTAAALDKINVAIVEKQRLVTLALNSVDNPKLAQDLGTALNIVSVLQTNRNASATDIGKALGLTPEVVRDIAGEFGYKLDIALVDAVQPVPVVILPETTKWEFWRTQPQEKIVHVRWVADNVKPVAGQALAAGGLVKGPGTWTSDSVLARLSNYEFVQPSRTVAHYGVGVMEALRHRRVPRELLNAIASGNYALAAKLVQANAVSTRPPAAVPVHAVAANRLEDRDAAAQSGPRTLTIVDHDGVFKGQMRVAAVKSHRDRAQAERLRRLGNWSS